MQLQSGSSGPGSSPVTQSIINNIEYTPNGSIPRIDYGNGAVAAYVFDPLTFRLTRHVVVDKTSTALQDNNYTIDPVGNILTVVNNATTAIKTKTYTYDFLNRLASSNDGSGVINYTYDTIGNILNKGGITYTYGQNGAGPHAVTGLSASYGVGKVVGWGAGLYGEVFKEPAESLAGSIVDGAGTVYGYLKGIPGLVK